MSTEVVAKDATPDAQGHTPDNNKGEATETKSDDGTTTTQLSNAKRKISQTLSPDGTNKKMEVGAETTKTISPDHKKRMTGKKRKTGKKKSKTSSPLPSIPHTNNDAEGNNTVTPVDSSLDYDTEDEIPLSGLSQTTNNTGQNKRPLRNVARTRQGRIRALLHRRQTPLKPKQPSKQPPKGDDHIPPTPQKKQTNTNPNIDLHAAINSIQSDLKDIKLDGSRLGETVQNMQREVIKIRNEMVTLETLDMSLTQMVRSVNAQLDAQKGEIDHNREKIIEIQERVEDVRVNIETQHTRNEDHESRLESIENTVMADLNSFRKEMRGFDERLSKVITPTPFLPSQNDVRTQKSGDKINVTIPKVPQGPIDNKNVVIEGLNEHPLEDLEGKVREMLHEIGITLSDADYNKMERLGKWSANRTWPRPIKLELMTSHKKAKIMASREYLGQTDDNYRVRVNSDEPKEKLVARAIIRQSANKARDEGRSVKQTIDSVTIDGVRYDLTTIREIGKALNVKEGQGGTSSGQKYYPTENKYAEDTCLLDTPRGMAFFTIRCKLSNFYPCPIRFNGRRYESAEHAYQAEKAIAAKAFDKLHDVLSAPTSARAKEIGKEIPETPLWSRIKVDRMRDILNAKFRQNKHLADYLCTFKGKEFIEANQFDSFWGAGASLNSAKIHTGRWAGRNELGKLLTELQRDLSRERDARTLSETHAEKDPPPPRRALPPPHSHSSPVRRVSKGHSTATSGVIKNTYNCLEVTHISTSTFTTRL